ncbi:MAG: 3-methyl-2-oxobutanoate dehydrogenase subunit beta, partial [Calditrichaeota bacterium]|nr:3-methyl-2-oxobutanoate dehydrogenase subunit beta [Calditrichota bacterium]
VDFSAAPTPSPPDKSSWAATGCKGRKPHLIKTLFLDPQQSEEHNRKLAAKYDQMRKNEVRFEKYNLDSGGRVVLVAFGTAARVCKTAVDELKEKGIEVGLLRPITLFPYPYQPLRDIAVRDKTRAFLVVEMNTGQMIDDVRLAVGDKKPIAFYGRQGGFVPSPEEVIGEIRKLL